ncbi:hypothetical protein SCUCBS95973_006855 [Sporothrix curviconia]|uniref:Uncharacterized protein n=1 Tax=Sporothrix curviconia TaxID=1260050 RepID=A0ABP0C975_9PEZI
MALAAVADNRAALGPDHIAGLNDKQRNALYETLKSRGDLSLKLWRLYLPYNRTTGDATSGPAHLYCTQHRQPGSSLDPYISVLGAPPYVFVAHVRITARFHADFGVSELMKLASLPHLGILEIIEHVAPAQSLLYEDLDSGDAHNALDANQVSDRLIKGWSLTQRAFSALRVLRLWGCDADMLTPACLQYAAAFPRLAHFEMSVGDTRDRVGTAADSWSKAKRAASPFGWTGFALGAQALQYRPSQDDCADPSASSANVILSKVEARSVPVDALLWGSCVYSFLKETGYDASKPRQALLEDVIAAGRDAKEVSRGSFALLGLGSDQADTRPSPVRPPDRTFCFVRTSEALAVLAAQREQRVETARPAENGPENSSLQTAPRRLTDARTLQPPPAKRRKGGQSIGSMLSDFTA